MHIRTYAIIKVEHDSGIGLDNCIRGRDEIIFSPFPVLPVNQIFDSCPDIARLLQVNHSLLIHLLGWFEVTNVPVTKSTPSSFQFSG